MFSPYTIAFSKNYTKLYNQKTARLLHVEELNINDKISQDFILYDTKAVDGSMFPLSKGKYLLLVFLGDKNIPFTTVRRYEAQKERYYKSNINKIFNVHIN